MLDVPRGTGQLIDDRWDPDHDAGHGGEPQPAQHPVAPIVARPPLLHDRPQRAGGEDRGDEQDVAGVALDAVAAGQHGERQEGDLAVDDRPHRQQEDEEREHGDPRVPRFDEERRSAGPHEDRQEGGHEQQQRHATAAEGEPEGDDERRQVDGRDADHQTEARPPEQRVHRVEQEPQARARMGALHPGVALDPPGGADQRRAVPEAAHVQLRLRHVARRVPVAAGEAHERDERRDDRHDGGEDDHPPRSPGQPAHATGGRRGRDLVAREVVDRRRDVGVWPREGRVFDPGHGARMIDGTLVASQAQEAGEPNPDPLPVRRGLRHYAHRFVMAPPRYVRILVAPFAASLLAGDLPLLRPARLDRTTAFVAGRVHTMPSPVRAGVVLVAAVVRALMLLPGRDRLVRLIGDHPLPLIGEYARPGAVARLRLRLGVVARHPCRRLGSRRGRRRVNDLLPISCEVVVIGSGAGGAPTAALLAEAGLDVSSSRRASGSSRAASCRSPSSRWTASTAAAG